MMMMMMLLLEKKKRRRRLTSETVEGATLSLEGVNNIHGSDSLPLGMLSVSDSITNHILQEDLEHGTGLFINQTRDTLDTTTTSQTTNGGFGDSLNVITKNLAMSLGSTLSKSLSSLSTS
jgi:hypothetical protein